MYPFVNDVLAQVDDRHRSVPSHVDFVEVARWGRWLGQADALDDSTRHREGFLASAIYPRLSPRSRRLFAYAYAQTVIA